jgi:hypothetical protein
MTELSQSLHPMHPLEAERQLIELVRGDDAEEFSVTITRRAGRFKVTLHPKPGQPEIMGAEGDGETFADAWHSIDRCGQEKRRRRATLRRKRRFESRGRSLMAPHGSASISSRPAVEGTSNDRQDVHVSRMRRGSLYVRSRASNLSVSAARTGGPSFGVAKSNAEAS